MASLFIILNSVKADKLKTRYMQNPSNRPIRIIMANRPRLLREMLGRILSRPVQVDVVGEVKTMWRLPLVVEALHPDWIVITLCNNGEFPGMTEILMGKNPDMGILAIDEWGETARALCGTSVFNKLAFDELIPLICSEDPSHLRRLHDPCH